MEIAKAISFLLTLWVSLIIVKEEVKKLALVVKWI